MNVKPFVIGYRITRTLAFNDDEIIAGAVFLGDRNPLHNDAAAAATSRFGGLIACGPHISGIHACMLPTHCTSLGFDVVGTTFTTRYTAPVHSNAAHEFTWTVTTTAPHRSGGFSIDWAGTVMNPTRRICIEATGQVLVTNRP
jgi:3-hydroxybutyryl-CoA dehydratase